MKTTLKIILFIFLSFTSTKVFSESPYLFRYDYSIFKGSEGKSIIEFYYSFYKKGLVFSYQEGQYSAEAQIDIDIFRQGSDDPVFAQTYKIPAIVPDTAGAVLDNNLVGQINYQVEPGDYTLRVIATDANNSLYADTILSDISVSSMTNGLSLSDIELATDILNSSDSKSIFYKNTLEVVPNPNNMYGNNMGKLYYYFELYGIKPGEITDDFYILSEIKDQNRERVFLKNVKKISDLSSSDIVQYGSFEIDSLPTSGYILSVAIVDSKNKQRLVKEKKFYTYNSGISEDMDMSGSDDYLKSPYPRMREDLLDKEFEITSYIRSSQETQAFNDLTNINEKRKFMYEFWKRRDNNQSTPQNEFKIDYINRVLQADASFKEQGREGWLTDRGRIFVLYGKPDDIERYSFEANQKSHEIWTYEKLEGGVMCVFIERPPEGSGFFDLVHSTIRGEIRNDNWESDLNY
jgi:GWxTD domain-containing protein